MSWHLYRRRLNRRDATQRCRNQWYICRVMMLTADSTSFWSHVVVYWLSAVTRRSCNSRLHPPPVSQIFWLYPLRLLVFYSFSTNAVRVRYCFSCVFPCACPCVWLCPRQKKKNYLSENDIIWQHGRLSPHPFYFVSIVWVRSFSKMLP